MRRTSPRTVVGAVGALTVAAALITSPNAATEAATPRPNLALSQSRAEPQGPTASTVLLITGDVVKLSSVPGGRTTTEIDRMQKSGPGAVVRSYDLDGHHYAVPQSAVPYLGTTLDPALFDVTGLAQRPHAGVDVQVSLTSPGAVASLPGLRITGRTGATVLGTFSPSGAKAFGAALASQSLRDHAAVTHRTGLFHGIARISSADTDQSTVRATSAGLPVSTLTLNGINWKGDPDTGDSFNVYNVDDFGLFARAITFADGQAEVIVPDGHYSAVGFFYNFSTGTVYQSTLAQFTVSGDTTVTIDARDSTAPLTFAPPKPATPKSTVVGGGRGDAKGQVGSYFLLAGDQPFFVKPIKKPPSVGKLYLTVASREYSTGAKKPYTFDFKYGSVGTISADQHYAPALSSLASVDTSYAADHPDQQSIDSRLPAFRWEQSIVGDLVPFTTPTRRTEYYTASRNVQWQGAVYQVYVPELGALEGHLDSSWRSYRPREHQEVTWADDPAHPRLFEQRVYPQQAVCPACLAGTTLDALVFPFSDNSPQHFGAVTPPTAGLTETAVWSVSADGDVVQQGTGVLQAAAPVGSASSYGIAYDTTRSSDDFRLSTETHTAWKVSADAPRVDLPRGWTCTLTGGTDCTVLPLMTVSYDLPDNLLGEIAAGDAQGSLIVGHLAGVDVNVTSLKVQISYDGGSTYQNVAVTDEGNGRFGLDLTVPKPGQTDGYGALSISVKDKNGSTLKETITRAFAVTPPR